MIVVPAGMKVHLAPGHTDMRKGMDRLAMLVQEHAEEGPVLGHRSVFPTTTENRPH